MHNSVWFAVIDTFKSCHIMCGRCCLVFLEVLNLNSVCGKASSSLFDTGGHERFGTSAEGSGSVALGSGLVFVHVGLTLPQLLLGVVMPVVSLSTKR